jgi:hypothetical protein
MWHTVSQPFPCGITLKYSSVSHCTSSRVLFCVRMSLRVLRRIFGPKREKLAGG